MQDNKQYPTSVEHASDSLGATTPCVAICGAGIAGLTLAAILSRQLGDRVQLAVFERASIDRDQGYGLDLDEHGQEALVKAGVYHRYWDVSRPYSDCMAWFPMHGTEPIGVMFRPALLSRWFPSMFAARPESNRGALRDILLEALEDNVKTSVRFDTPVTGIQLQNDGRATLSTQTGEALGTFDLIIDAMGLHSTLRDERVLDAAGGRVDTGNIMIHGVIQNPETRCCSELVDALDRFGTISTFGRGHAIFVQRFGAGMEDNRVSVFYMVSHLENEAELLGQIGIDKPDSRASGIMRDERLELVKRWVLEDMGEVLDPLWRNAIECLERVTVREEVTHGLTKLRSDCMLPLICVGDSLRNCGLGGGGILAMQDAIEMSKLFEDEKAIVDNKLNLELLRSNEQEMLKRKQDFSRRKAVRFDQQRKRVLELGRGPGSLADWFPAGVPLFLARLILPALGKFSSAWYRRERRRRGKAGSDAGTSIYPNVRKLLERGEGF
ncbi:MAG: hypothetical protein AAF541_23865 [Pseudomonadota bacterium]